MQVLGSGTITTTTAPLVFVEYNYIVPTPYSAGSWEWYDHGHDGPPRVCIIQLHCTDTLQCRFLGVVRSQPRQHPSCLYNTTTLYRHLTVQVLGSGTITTTTAPLVFVEYNYIVPTPYSAGSWEWYDHGHDGTPHVCRIQLHCTDTLQLQVLGSGTITITMAPSCL